MEVFVLDIISEFGKHLLISPNGIFWGMGSVILQPKLYRFRSLHDFPPLLKVTKMMPALAIYDMIHISTRK
jgi:hypothetical protein